MYKYKNILIIAFLGVLAYVYRDTIKALLGFKKAPLKAIMKVSEQGIVHQQKFNLNKR